MLCRAYATSDLLYGPEVVPQEQLDEQSASVFDWGISRENGPISLHQLVDYSCCVLGSNQTHNRWLEIFEDIIDPFS
jgi:hypothetical protein